MNFRERLQEVEDIAQITFRVGHGVFEKPDVKLADRKIAHPSPDYARIVTRGKAEVREEIFLYVDF